MATVLGISAQKMKTVCTISAVGWAVVAVLTTLAALTVLGMVSGAYQNKALGLVTGIDRLVVAKFYKIALGIGAGAMATISVTLISFIIKKIADKRLADERRSGADASASE